MPPAAAQQQQEPQEALKGLPVLAAEAAAARGCEQTVGPEPP